VPVLSLVQDMWDPFDHPEVPEVAICGRLRQPVPVPRTPEPVPGDEDGVNRVIYDVFLTFDDPQASALAREWSPRHKDPFASLVP